MVAESCEAEWVSRKACPELVEGGGLIKNLVPAESPLWDSAVLVEKY